MAESEKHKKLIRRGLDMISILSSIDTSPKSEVLADLSEYSTKPSKIGKRYPDAYLKGSFILEADKDDVVNEEQITTLYEFAVQNDMTFYYLSLIHLLMKLMNLRKGYFQRVNFYLFKINKFFISSFIFKVLD